MPIEFWKMMGAYCVIRLIPLIWQPSPAARQSSIRRPFLSDAHIPSLPFRGDGDLDLVLQALHPGIIELHVRAHESRDDTPRFIRKPVMNQPPGALRQDVNHEEDHNAEGGLERNRETPLRLV
jgi:hypothetical protein